MATWIKDRNKWCARIRRDGITKYLGYYATEDEADKVFEEAVRATTPLFTPLTISRIDAAVIHLPNGQLSLISSSDWDNVSKYRWHNSDGYVKTNRSAPQRGLLQLHRLIMDPPAGMDVDHINGNGLDNRRCNLRIATRSQNRMNERIRPAKATSRFKGVSWNTKSRCWVVNLKLNGEQKHLGSFPCEIAAANAYDDEAIRLFGDFAATNASLGRLNKE
jgi:hypothetical protein